MSTPENWKEQTGGLYSQEWTVRDQLASDAMKVLIAMDNGDTIERLSEKAYRQADAMIRARAR